MAHQECCRALELVAQFVATSGDLQAKRVLLPNAPWAHKPLESLALAAARQWLPAVLQFNRAWDALAAVAEDFARALPIAKAIDGTAGRSYHEVALRIAARSALLIGLSCNPRLKGVIRNWDGLRGALQFQPRVLATSENRQQFEQALSRVLLNDSALKASFDHDRLMDLVKYEYETLTRAPAGQPEIPQTTPAPAGEAKTDRAQADTAHVIELRDSSHEVRIDGKPFPHVGDLLDNLYRLVDGADRRPVDITSDQMNDLKKRLRSGGFAWLADLMPRRSPNVGYQLALPASVVVRAKIPEQSHNPPK